MMQASSENCIANFRMRKTNLVLPFALGVGVRAVHDPVASEDVEFDAAEVKLEQAGRFVASVPNEALVTELGQRGSATSPDSVWKQLTGGPSLGMMT